ncbi:MAG: gliding motility-associated C-terminal domain-containing protein [Saprospiraceae bacterium]
MKAFTITISIHIVTALLFSNLVAQAGCISSYGAVYGSPNFNEEGHCIVSTAGGDGVYIAGSREDSVLLMKVDLNGKVLWARTFDIIPGEPDIVYTLILDSDGMLACFGASGDLLFNCSIFGFRYNPNTDQVLWSNEYESAMPRDFGEAIVQLGSGGNYLLAGNPSMLSGTNDLELIEINRVNGNIITGVYPKNYNLGGSESFADMIYEGNFIYGVGRYTDGVPNSKMRNTLVKIDPVTGTHVWARLGHLPANLTARLYGVDLLIDQNEIYSTCTGDPLGTTTTNTKMYVQKTSTDGNLIWLNQYDLPGTNDFSYEIIKSGGGYVVLAGRAMPPRELYLFKIDNNGAVLWAKNYMYTDLISPLTHGAHSQLIEVGGQLFFTGWGMGTSGTTDLIIMRTDLNGEVVIPCVTSQNISIPVIAVVNPSFYNVTMTQFSMTLNTNAESTAAMVTDVPSFCNVSDTLVSLIQATICAGDSYEGFSMAGVYEDYFTTSNGCDSLRRLTLDVYTPIATSEQVEICLGSSYAGHVSEGTYIDMYQNFLGCDSVHTIILTVTPLISNLNVLICEGQSYAGYAVSGFYIDTIQGPLNSCDTIRNLNLTVLPTVSTFIQAAICEGESYEGYTATGVFTDVFTSVAGCDSIRMIELTVSYVDRTEENVVICLGESYNGYSVSGVYTYIHQNIFGCDSVHTLNLDVIPLEQNIVIEICAGEQYEGYSTTGLYVDTLQGFSNDCDTIRYLALTVNPINNVILDVTICSGGNYEGYSASGQYIDFFLSSKGCDSTRTLNLTVSNEIFTSIDISICAGENYYGHTTSGLYTDTLISTKGCDSVRTVRLTTMDEITTHIESSVCVGFYTGHTAEGTYIDTLISYTGCDSIRTIVLSGESTYIPNVFSPNGDGINDLFTVSTFPDHSPDIQFFGIYDRFGDVAYQTEEWPIQWNGKRRNGEEYNPGVFAYVLIYFCGKEKITETGSITIVK